MKKLNILKSFSGRKFRHGGYATLITAVVVALLFVVNLVVGMIPGRLDLTPNKIYSLSEQTYNVLDKVDEDITIYGVYESGNVNNTIDEIVKGYRDGSKNIYMDSIDPIRDPLTAQRYMKDGKELSMGSLVVESGERFRVITPAEMVDRNTESLLIEQRITSAILYILGEDTPVAYVLGGHDERPLPAGIISQMKLENFEVKDLNLLASDGVPEDASLLIINSPQRDLMDEEEAYITEFLDGEGRALFLMNPTVNPLPNFELILNSYGVGIQNAVIIEGVSERYAGGNPLWVIPEFKSHQIIDPIVARNALFFIPAPQGIEILDVARRTIEIDRLMITSDKAFARSASSTSVNLEKEEGDLEGPFNLGVAVTDTVYNLAANESMVTRLVVIGNSAFLETGLEGGMDLVLNSLNWLYEREEGITVRPKSLKAEPLNINEMQYRIYGAVTVIIIPLLILIAGLVVWLRRRHL